MSELILESHALITSKTDLKGRILYCNDQFLKYAEYSEEDILFQPHNIVRSKDIPKSLFKILWSTITQGQEVFAFIKNKTKYDNFYWVFANITPSYDNNDNVIGYYSVRRKPNPNAIKFIEPLYREILKIEQTTGIREAQKFITQQHSAYNLDYNQFIIALQRNGYVK